MQLFRSMWGGAASEASRRFEGLSSPEGVRTSTAAESIGTADPYDFSRRLLRGLAASATKSDYEQKVANSTSSFQQQRACAQSRQL